MRTERTLASEILTRYELNPEILLKNLAKQPKVSFFFSSSHGRKTRGVVFLFLRLGLILFVRVKY